MKNTFLKILWLISGVLLLFAGVVTMVNPAGTLASIAFILALVLLISGILGVVGFACNHDAVFGSGWVLVDGILDIVLALILFFNQFVAAAILPYLFAMWIIFTGLTRAITAFDLKKLGARGWYWLLAVGILMAALGVLALFEPVVAAVAISVFVGLFFLVQGISSVCLWAFFQRMDR